MNYSNENAEYDCKAVEKRMKEYCANTGAIDLCATQENEWGVSVDMSVETDSNYFDGNICTLYPVPNTDETELIGWDAHIEGYDMMPVNDADEFIKTIPDAVEMYCHFQELYPLLRINYAPSRSGRIALWIDQKIGVVPMGRELYKVQIAGVQAIVEKFAVAEFVSGYVAMNTPEPVAA